MNNLRRKHLSRISDKLTELQEEVQVMLDLEQEAYDNLPESLQSSDRGEQMEDTISALEEAITSFQDLTGYLAEARGEV